MTVARGQVREESDLGQKQNHERGRATNGTSFVDHSAGQGKACG